MKNIKTNTKFLFARLTLAMAFATVLILCGAANAATLTVTSTGDTTVGAAGCADGCSLREAITAAASGDTINFSSLFNTAQTINLNVNTTGGGLTIAKNLTITGPGARLLTVRRNVTSQYNYGTFTVNSGFTVSISGLTANNGNASTYGGAFTNFGTLTLNGVAATGDQSPESAVSNTGTMTILNSTISGNANIGIVSEAGTLTIANSTISGNNGTNSTGLAGGIYHWNTAMLYLNNVTIANNTNGGIQNDTSSGTINIRNTIIAGNTVFDINGAFVSQGNNLVGNTTGGTGFTQPTDKLNIAANLAALADNGGNTNTHKPNTGSPAINAGNNCVVTATCGTNNPPVALTNDQRGTGFTRNFNSTVDIGAIEASSPTAANVSLKGRVLTANGRGIRNVSVTIFGGDLSEPRTVSTSSFGYYRFNDLAAGQVYILEVRGKRYSFTNPTRVVSLLEDLAEENFIAEQ